MGRKNSPADRESPAGQFNLRQSSHRAVGFTADRLRKAWANPACAEGPCTTLGRPLVRVRFGGLIGGGRLLETNETIFRVRRNRRATKAGYQALVLTERVVHQMIEAVAIIVGLFGAGIFVAHAVEAHLTAGDWLGRLRSVRSMYRQAS
jgi:hypothetical protein